MVLHIVKMENEQVDDFVNSIKRIKEDLKFCSKCHNLSDHAICSICADRSRNEKMICVVESVRDVMAIEETDQYHGVYHVLGGVISPLEGISSSDLKIDELIKRVEENQVQELIMGISPTIEGDTTVFYISRKIDGSKVKISLLSRGVAFGGELEYTDELTLGRSLISRVPYAQTSGL